jgi:exonuclease SbcD
MLLITDTHLKSTNIEDTKSIFRQAFAYAKKYSCPIIHCGDICDERVGWGAELQKVFHNILIEAEREQVDIYCIAGNHDKKDLNDTFSYLSPFQFHRSFNLHEDVGVFKYREVYYHFLPYFKEKDLYPIKLQQAQSNIVRGAKNVLITHISIESVRNNDGSEVDSSHGIALNSFSAFDKVIVGHYHNKQFFKNICYIGSTFPHNFGENNDKGIVYLNDDLELEYLPTYFKKYNLIKVDVLNEKDVEGLYLMDNSNSEGDYFKVVINGSPSLIDSIDKKRVLANKIETKKVGSLLSMSSDIVLHNKSSIQDSFVDYCKEKNLNLEEGILICKE